MNLTVKTVFKRSFETQVDVGSTEKTGNFRTGEVTDGEKKNEKLMKRLSRCRGDNVLWRRGEQ